MSLKIVHAPKNPAGLASSLAVGERALGHDVETIEALSSFRGDDADRNLHLDRYRGARYLAACASASRDHPASDIVNLWFGASYVHYPRFGFNLVDLPHLARKGAVVATYVGSDARIASEHSVALREAERSRARFGSSDRALARLESGQRAALKKMRRYAKHLFAVNPDLLRFLPADEATFLPYPVRDHGYRSSARVDEGPLRVLHAPTNRAVKGTASVLAAVEEVQRLRPDAVELVLVERQSQERFLEAMTEADLYIDQLLVGWYGVSAVEAMIAGTPVICFVDDQDLPNVPADMANELPIIRADAQSLSARLVALVDDRSAIAAASEAGQSFAARWHDPETVAAQTTAVYRDVIG